MQPLHLHRHNGRSHMFPPKCVHGVYVHYMYVYIAHFTRYFAPVANHPFFLFSISLSPFPLIFLCMSTPFHHFFSSRLTIPHTVIVVVSFSMSPAYVYFLQLTPRALGHATVANDRSVYEANSASQRTFLVHTLYERYILI